MVPKGTVLQRTAANCRLTHHVSAMADVLTSPVSTAACLGASGGRLEPLAAAAQSKDWQKKSLAPFATIATVGVLRIWSPDNSRVSRSIDT